MTWLAILLMVVAAACATAGAVVALGQRSGAAEEAGTQRGITVLWLLAAAVAAAAIGAAMLGAHATRSAQIGVFAAAAATVALPLMAVGLSRRARRSDRDRRSSRSGRA
ncbi:hypothetical protein JKP75_11885 [Blastococcus sp. TML/M2B]|uniref:hypothetical protein n=1 Tax=unclassified Blastococcus TaxID=2619396 RepID=UPI0019099C12|nr:MULTISPECIES: hypothetical protein [unclassified Blastococcus]MBN1093195.1 hypothetical protein [Blastococcus sp. TML/M2B]MBN1096691.1 hypothetical protein [Blastococcus sp. TML/C7B]